MPEKTPAKTAAPKRKPRAATSPEQPDLPNIPAPDPVANISDSPPLLVTPQAVVLRNAFESGSEVEVFLAGQTVTGRVSSMNWSEGMFVISDPSRHVVVFGNSVYAVSFRTIGAAASAIGANDPA